MFLEASKGRKIVTEKNYDEDLTQKEIYAATRIQLRRNPRTNRFNYVSRPFRHLWVMLMEACGEKCPKFEIQKAPKLEPIQSCHELNKYHSYRPKISKSYYYVPPPKVV